MKNKRGFTLAEVLVTLAIIGVVAALTIPTLIGSSQERQAKTSVKKAMSILNQALTMSIAVDSAGANSVTATNGNALKELFRKHLSTLDNDDTNAAITTADGMVYSFLKTGATCPVAVNNVGATATSCMVEVDINGDGGNEVAGSKTSYTDLYYFLIYDSMVVPANTADATTGKGGFRNTAAAAIDDVAQDCLIN